MEGGKHHPDCDEFRMHSVEAVRQENGTYKPACPLCGPLPVVGSFGSKASARAAVSHSSHEPCAGQCLEWEAAA